MCCRVTSSSATRSAPPTVPTIAADLVVQSLGEGITDRDETHEGLLNPRSQLHHRPRSHVSAIKDKHGSHHHATGTLKDLAAEGFPLPRRPGRTKTLARTVKHRQHRHSGWQTARPRTSIPRDQGVSVQRQFEGRTTLLATPGQPRLPHPCRYPNSPTTGSSNASIVPNPPGVMGTISMIWLTANAPKAAIGLVPG